MKFPVSFRDQRGSTIVVVLVLCTITLLIMASTLQWSTTNTTLSQRNNEYFRTIAVAEAATEKVISRMAADYRKGGDTLIQANSNSYPSVLPTGSENAIFHNYQFSDGNGNQGKVFVDRIGTTQYRALTSQYRGLRGYSTPYRVIANAKQTDTLFQITGAVRQDFEITTIPLFQFAIFYNLDLEIHPGPEMHVTGPVHCNENIYISPDDALTFESDITAAGDIFNHRKPGDPLDDGSGTLTFNGKHTGGTSSLNLPIGTNNTPESVREVVEVPPAGEAADSEMGKERFYNKADLIITLSNSSTKVTSGRFNNFATVIPRSQWSPSSNSYSGFLTTNSFFNQRENKTIKSVQIDVSKLVRWNATNALLRDALNANGRPSAGNVSIIYVVDHRTQSSSTQAGLLLVNGTNLPPNGLTVATPHPLYVRGHYNAPSGVRGTANTAGTLPASLIGDAINVLSDNWSISSSYNPLSSRLAADTTVNAAFLAGIVQTTGTTNSGDYSGGVENFPRFLETWGDAVTFTYNGSMVVMFPSKYATGLWQGTGEDFGIYEPPTRQWAFDENFTDPTKLPPGTPMMRGVVRNKWTMIKPNSTVVATP